MLNGWKWEQKRFSLCSEQQQQHLQSKLKMDAGERGGLSETVQDEVDMESDKDSSESSDDEVQELNVKIKQLKQYVSLCIPAIFIFAEKPHKVA